jgi:NADH:ubiquinone reductase (non-electrogenic)
MEIAAKPRVVLLGTGFATFGILSTLKEELFDITVVSPRNHFLFTPLLPSTTVGTIEFRSIIESIRGSHPRIRYYQASCTSLNVIARSIMCESADDHELFSLPYDKLVSTVGAETNSYGIPGVREYTRFLKSLEDARQIRQDIVRSFERASQPNLSDEERTRLLHFVVVGGGPTGVEFAAELHDFINDVRKLYAELRPFIAITLLEAGPQILNSFDATLSAYAARHFARRQICVRTGSAVTEISERSITLNDGTVIPCGLVVWTSGVGQTAFVRSLAVEKDRAGRIVVDEFLRVKDLTDVYALGDCAANFSLPLPATAQVAQQQGVYLGKQLNAIAQTRPVAPFRYKNLGMLAYIGGERALADLSRVKAGGFITFIFWRSVYLTKLLSMKNKILVLFDWMKAAVFGRDVSRF